MFPLASSADRELKNRKQERCLCLPRMSRRWRGKARTTITAVLSRKEPPPFTLALADLEAPSGPGEACSAPANVSAGSPGAPRGVGLCGGPSGALCPGSLSREPNNAGCSWPGRARLTRFRVLGEVLWGNRTGSVSTMTTSAPVSAVQKQNSKKCYHTKS